MALASLRWGCRFLVVLIIFQGVCVMFYKQNTHSFRDVMTETLQKLRCAKLRHKFSVIKPAKSIKLKSFTRELSNLMSCPDKSNITERELNRMRLRFCCNATESFVLTKRNTAVNQSIPYETNKQRTFKINADIHKMLPKDSPWSAGALGLCAVVGSSGILKNSSCGSQIDSADFVIRFNLALINDIDVGLKTNLITINPSQIRYRNLEKKPGPLVKRVSVYGNSSLIIPAFAYPFCTSPSLRVLRVLQPIRPQQPVLFFSPHYLNALDLFWKGRGLKEKRLSTGFMLISAALEMCEHVHVYGFWPFDTDLQENPIPYHYYDQKKANRFMHRMPEEFVYLLQLHSQGALTLHLQPCDTH
ncbi:ST8 alpha-N-acetyl-neuraminide alpha-2,8-sialyltransferase 7.1 [Danio aesculapii]|uniref:ST8 alpha-N-acetyl-neuraminide alpha-2,8-sialyltransferase 7.1 n=1 Tax=Danio aesculapii TaxID=1142201 RepID=UPI0024BF8F19|nr:ST8 alpha-N-acetyl-neuraminide alpha-2,8-sialyltransferase 7.1 [Danio aesculapii]